MKMAGSTARLAAVETLLQLENTGKPFSILFEAVARQYRVEGSDRQLAMKIIYGVLRNRDHLDRLLDLLCERSADKIKPFVRQALRSGLYQICFLDRMPPPAAINETVNVIKARGLPARLQGFVNGVLRQYLRLQAQLPLPHDPDGNGRPVLNHPAWLTDRWHRLYGEKTMIDICRHNNLEPLLSLRAGSEDARRTLCEQLSRDRVLWEAGAYARQCVIVRDFTGPVTEIAGIRSGRVHVQDQAAQLATMLLAPFTADLAVLDGCAGLGGKTIQLIELAEGKRVQVTAVEPDPRRFRTLKESLASLRDRADIHLVDRPLQEYAATCTTRFDRVLVDAPCSGTGVIGRHPDIRWNRRERDLAGYAGRQLELLSTAAGMAAPGGVMVYSTCSIEPEENEQVVDRFLDQNPDFCMSDCRRHLPGTCGDLIRNGCFAPLPSFGLDGFFAARLVKRIKDD